MTELAVFMDHPFVEATGLALLHAVWQITMLGGLLVLLNQALRSAQARYLAGCIVLLAMIAVPVGTGVYVYEAGVALPGPFAEILPATPLAPTTVTPLVSEVVAPPAEHATSRGYSVAGWLPWVVVGWLVGMVLLSIRLLGGWTLTRRLVASGARVDGTWQRRFDALRGRMHVEQAVRFLQTSRVSGPVVIGSLRPVVLVPMGLLAGLPPAQVELILLHELAHIRRHDYLVNLLQSMAEVALFFHPVAWW
ncbi:MAG: M56 family metallopeptidase, partial [Bacteroidota bacterium]